MRDHAVRAFLVNGSLIDSSRLGRFQPVSLEELRGANPSPDDLVAVNLAGKVDVASVIEAAGNATVIGYYPHVEAELAEAARQAGCTLVMPRSRFFRVGDPEQLLEVAKKDKR
jgi:hypothetical protein